MNFDQTVNFRTRTAGNGYWSSTKKLVTINRVHLNYIDGDGWAELCAYFDPAEWDIKEEGLIYSDMGWMKSFKACMATLGFSDAALADINFSEQGMQGVDFVSMDAGPNFIQECEALYRFTINKQAVNM